MMKRRIGIVISVLMLLLLGVVVAHAQDEPIYTSEVAQFSVYTCTFNTATGRADIRATLINRDGTAMRPEDVTINVSRVGASSPLPPDAATVAVADPRPPLRMIIVLDTTDTMPIETVRDTLFSSLISNLPFEDEVALVTVNSDVSQPTDFYVDTNAFYNDHLFEIPLGSGDNRINDGILAGVSVTQPNSPRRQVVLVITDSTPQVEQASDEEIITRAQASHAQIIPIALHTTSGVPDDEALFALATSTRGYGFAYDGDKRVAFTEEGLNRIFADILTVLNSEIVISVDLAGLEPDETGFIPFDVSALPNTSQTALTDRVSCPLPPPAEVIENALPTFAIAFTNIVDGLNLNDPTSVEVAVQPFDALPADARFVFLLDDGQSDPSVEGIFPVDPQSLPPGVHTIRAQLRDGSGNILATTPTTSLFVRRDLVLATAENKTDNLSGAVTIQARNASDNMTTVEFRAALANSPTVSYPIGTAPVQEGVASLTISDIQAEASRLFPQDDPDAGWTVQITASAPSSNAGDPPLGDAATPLILSIAPRPPFTVDSLLQTPIIPVVAGVIFLVIDVLLLRQIRKARIRRTIEGADNRDLPAQLMCVTVSRGGAGRQTFMITKKTTWVGRGSGNDISLEDDANVSRQHGAILWRKGHWYFANRKPKVKTKVAGKMYKGLSMTRLENPTDLELGSYQMVFHSTEQRQDISDLVKTNL